MSITLVGLGLNQDQLTKQGEKAILSAKHVVVTTSKSPSYAYFENIPHTTLDKFYDSSDDFDQVSEKACEYILSLKALLRYALTVTEFKSRNEAFNQQLRTLETQLATIQIEERRQKESALDLTKIRAALDRELSFEDGINSNLVATILEKIVVKKESPKEEIHLDIYLKLGAKFEVILPSTSFSRARNTMPRGRTRRI